MKSTSRFKINAPDTIHETVDNEAVIVNLKQGHYYSLNKTATDVWNLITQSASIEEIVHCLSKHCPQTEVENMESTIKQFVTQLQEENLIVINDIHSDQSSATTVDMLTEKNSFELPALQKFTDMQDLLMLDPIHEVDDTGWPYAKSEMTTNQ